MMIFEKAIENFAKNRKEFYNRALKHDIAEFSKAVEKMTATGKCTTISCCDCPITLAREMYDITKIEVVDGKDTDLHVDKPVYAIHLANVRETE